MTRGQRFMITEVWQILFFALNTGEEWNMLSFMGRTFTRKRLEMIRPDALVPVPIHFTRMKSRGYNQAQLIARELSRHSGIPVNEKLIKREVRTRPLKNLSHAERQNNLKRAFKICL